MADKKRSNPKISSIKTSICQWNETITLNLTLWYIQISILEMYAIKYKCPYVYIKT